MTGESESHEAQGKRPPWEKARDEALDEMAGQSRYEWEDVQVAIMEVVKRWRQESDGDPCINHEVSVPSVPPNNGMSRFCENCGETVTVELFEP